ncbi:MAG: hypothetical protein ACKVQV_05940 [Bacteroidia bacterium]
MKAKKTIYSKLGSVSTKKKYGFRTDFRQVASLLKIGKTAAQRAIRSSKALGLSITFMEKGVLYREHPDGTKDILNDENLVYVSSKTNKLNNLKIGDVLNVRKS